MFCPTQTAIDNLEKEGGKNSYGEIVMSGDVMQDAAMFYAEKAKEKNTISKEILNKDFILCTLHRAENTDSKEKLTDIVNALNEIQKTTNIVLPLHPRTAKKLNEFNLKLNVTTIEPVGYFDMITLLENCKMVMTDSGGLQKEAFFFHKNCVTLREQTEWVELVENGYNKLAGSNYDQILKLSNEMLSKSSDFSKNLYGNGNAAEAIAQWFVNQG